MSEGKVRALSYQVVQVGKHLKFSKKRYFWSVCIGQRGYSFLLDDSLLSGKSKLSINGKVFHQVDQSSLSRTKYDHSFIIDGCLFNILQTEDAFQMRINNKLFSHMLTQERGQGEFKEHKVEEDCFELEGRLRQGQGKKITLSLPGMGNGMKKKKGPTVQTDNWSQFAGSSHFPNFFGQSETKQNITTAKMEHIALQEKTQSVNMPTPEEFTTLQNLFQTISTYGQYVPKPNQQKTPTYDISEIPSIPETALQQFNTMQNLFATINNQTPKTEEFPKTKLQDFNTMQNLFNTLQLQTKKQVKSQKEKPSFEDFNTMQNLFTTINQPKPVAVASNTPQVQTDVNKININDFSTLQNLFATGLPLPIPLKTQVTAEQQFHTVKGFTTNTQNKQETTNFSNINLNDFSTIQNLFSTNNFLPPKQVLGSTDKANKVEQPSKKTESVPNQADFNTIQNLFATNAGKNENSFWKF